METYNRSLVGCNQEKALKVCLPTPVARQPAMFGGGITVIVVMKPRSVMEERGGQEGSDS